MIQAWLALVAFSDPDTCLEYVKQNNLMEQIDWQCILIEEAVLAPTYSLRPQQRPEQSK